MDAKRYGKWVALEELGRGGQGVVYKAIKHDSKAAWYRDMRKGISGTTATSYEDQNKEASDLLFGAIERRLKGEFAEFGALKVLHKPQYEDDAYKKAKKRMRSEITALASISHDHLMRVLDHDVNKGWVVFEYYEAGTLLENLGVFKGKVREALEAFRPLVAGCAALHDRELIHRDIKPGNIFMREYTQLVLGDFGLVWFDDPQHTRVTESFEKVGTTDFMPPWLISVGRLDAVKPSFDVFALGKILWCLLSGERVIPLYYIDREQHDLRKRFPDDRLVELVHERILKKTVVEDEDDCLPDAKSLLTAVDEVISLAKSEEARLCRACLVGRYVGDAGAGVGQPSRITLFCDNCGHELVFRFGGELQLPEWVRQLQDKRGNLS